MGKSFNSYNELKSLPQKMIPPDYKFCQLHASNLQSIKISFPMVIFRTKTWSVSFQSISFVVYFLFRFNRAG
jgi:hypothetical protein